MVDVVIVGAGLAGLSCGRRLAQLGIPFTLVEAADRVGGRVITDVIDGYRLDRGFQVLLDSYPEAKSALDFDGLGMRPFSPGALIWSGGRFHRVVDPWRAPFKGLKTLAAPFVTVGDGLKMAKLRQLALSSGRVSVKGTMDEFLREQGFSNSLHESFFRPFFAGVTLDSELSIPATWFLSLFGWFATGSAVLPAKGMQAIPEHLAKSLPDGAMRLGTRVRSIQAGSPTVVELDSGERLTCDAVAVATDGSAATRLSATKRETRWVSTTTLYYAASESPVGEPILVLNGEGASDGPVNHLAVLTDAQPSYSPDGSALASVSVMGLPDVGDDVLDRQVRAQLTGWYDDSVRDWRLLRVDRIPQALPRWNDEGESGVDGVHVCGDHVASPSIQGAMESGRLVAERLHEALATNVD